MTRQYNYTELVGFWGGLAPMHLAARQGEVESVKALIDAGADVNQRGAGDPVTPLVIATMNGHFDLAKLLLDKGADPNLAQANGVTPLYAALNCQWSDKALYPQPRAYEQQRTTYLDLMKAMLEKGANPNARLMRKVWYAQYDFDQSGVDESGATPFFRAAYAADVDGEAIWSNTAPIPTSARGRSGPGPHRDVTREVVRTCRRCRRSPSEGPPSPHCSRRQARATAKASRRTIITTRPPGCCPRSSTWSKRSGWT